MSYTEIINIGKQCINDIMIYWYECKNIAVMAGFGAVAVGIILMAGSVLFIKENRQNKSYYPKQLLRLLIVFFDGIYAAYLLYVTLGMRYIGQRQEVNLVPFQVSYVEIRFVVENVLLFIPFGFLAPITSKKFSKYKWVFVSTLIISVCIEACQYIFRCGKTEVDDVLLNAAGASAGFLCYKILKITKKRTR